MTEQKKILIVDDEPDIAKVTMLRLKNAGYQVINAVNGIQALEIIEAERPDLILLDLGLPDIGGAEVYQRMQKNKAIKDTPVIVFSAKHSTEITKEELEMPVEGFLSKPYEPVELLTKIREALDNRGQSL